MHMKQLSQKVRQQRLQVADRIRKHMVDAVPRILPVEVEDRVKDFASNVESLVDKVVSGGRGTGPGRGSLRLGKRLGWQGKRLFQDEPCGWAGTAWGWAGMGAG